MTMIEGGGEGGTEEPTDGTANADDDDVAGGAKHAGEPVKEVGAERDAEAPLSICERAVRAEAEGSEGLQGVRGGGGGSVGTINSQSRAKPKPGRPSANSFSRFG